MTGRRDEVEQSVHPVVTEARVTLDTGLLGKNIVVLTLEVAHDLLETTQDNARERRRVSVWDTRATYANSLSMLSPNPGVSTMVRAIRTPSSSSSTRYGEHGGWPPG